MTGSYFIVRKINPQIIRSLQFYYPGCLSFGNLGCTDGTKKENSVFAQPCSEKFKISQQLAGEGKIKTFVGKTFLMNDAVTAIKQFESRQLSRVGKVVLTA